MVIPIDENVGTQYNANQTQVTGIKTNQDVRERVWSNYQIIN